MGAQNEKPRLEWQRLVECLNSAEYEADHELTAPAKLNLRLKVLGRRPDGYHLLSMLNVSSTLQDDLTIRLTRDPGYKISFASGGPTDIPAEENIITKAFVAFWNEFGCEEPPVGFTSRVTKRIPIGGGLGGGSSDAGAMLRFLVGLFRQQLRAMLRLSDSEFDQRVLSAAVRVGADVPYAYRGGACWVTGIGDVIQPLTVSSVWPGYVLITVPPAPVPTIAFYQYFRTQHPLINPLRDTLMEHISRAGSLEISAELLDNDFEQDVCRLVPVVATALQCAREFFPETSSLTGSGSAIFSLVAPEQLSRVERYEEAASSRGMTVHRVRLLGG
jgi:4-diphosphocytidyl-2-C-methyl-D-erythritol kinase